MVAFVYIINNKVEYFNKWLFKDVDEFIDSRTNKWELNKKDVKTIIQNFGSYLICNVPYQMVLFDTDFKEDVEEYNMLFRDFYKHYLRVEKINKICT